LFSYERHVIIQGNILIEFNKAELIIGDAVMVKARIVSCNVVSVFLALLLPFLCAQDDSQSEREAIYYKYLDFPKYVKGGKVEPHWMADGNSFWYAEGAPENTVVWKVDPVLNSKKSLFDIERLRSVQVGEDIRRVTRSA